LALIDQRRIRQAFLSTGLELKACNIRRFVAEATTGPKAVNDRCDIISTSYKQAVMAMLAQIRLARQDGWVSTSREAGIFWLRIMKDKICEKG
jgi:hypothetical protein